jgi:hypothetical protein
MLVLTLDKGCSNSNQLMSFINPTGKRGRIRVLQIFAINLGRSCHLGRIHGTCPK